MNSFNPNQIVCLDTSDHSLYCEVIDDLQSQEKLWLRPLFLIKFHSTDHEKVVDKKIDLRYTADLLWKKTEVRIVYDMEYIALYQFFTDFNFNEVEIQQAKKNLHHFIKVFSAQPN